MQAQATAGIETVTVSLHEIEQKPWFKTAVSSRNSSPSQKLCHHVNEGRILNDLAYSDFSKPKVTCSYCTGSANCNDNGCLSPLTTPQV